MSHCLFCKIKNGEIPSEKVYENKNVFAFKDIQPMAKDHFLFIHKDHSNNVNDMESTSIAEVFKAIKEFTQSSKLYDDGFRVVTNVGKNGCQSVFHTHFHVLGGEKLSQFGR